jgi:serine/threonine protein kinase
MRTVGGYVLEAKLGDGGMGAVFRPDSLARFDREMQARARVAHAHIIKILGGGSDKGQAYYAMELAPGRSLDRLVAAEGTLAPERATRIVREIAAAIVHAHERGILHRDLKPENVLVDGEQVRVCDFGLARLAESETLTKTGSLLGTPFYSAPEQLMARARRSARRPTSTRSAPCSCSRSPGRPRSRRSRSALEAAVARSAESRRGVSLEPMLLTIQTQAHFKPIRRWLQVQDWQVSPEDTARAASGRYEFRQPAFTPRPRGRTKSGS